MLACGVVVAALVWSTFGPSSPSAMPTRSSVPGTCHVAEDPTELTATASDTGPAVPCNEPHQAETLWTGWITGPLGTEKERPNPELMNATLGRACEDFGRVQAYLGADAHDAQWGIIVMLKVPTPGEWAGGERTFRCEATAPAGRLGGPVLIGTLRDALRRKDSASLRLCETSGAALTCDLGHDREAVGPSVALEGQGWPGEQALRAAAASACRPVAEEYLGASLPSRPEVVVTADIPSRNDWEAGKHSAACWLDNSTGGSTSGTVRGGLR